MSKCIPNKNNQSKIKPINTRRSRKRRLSGNSTFDNYAKVAYKALNIATSVAAIINSEGKYLDPNVASASATSNGTISCMTGVARGTGPSDRNGDSILLKEFSMKYLVKWNTSNTDSQSFIRFLLIRDINDESDTAPTLAQVLTYPTAPSSAVSLLNETFIDRFQLLYDKTHFLDAYHGGDIATFSVPFNPSQSNPTRNPWHTTFNGTNGTDTSKGHLYLIVIGSGTTNMNTFTYAGRLIYYDN